MAWTLRLGEAGGEATPAALLLAAAAASLAALAALTASVARLRSPPPF
jgi:hypothetical protein